MWKSTWGCADLKINETQKWSSTLVYKCSTLPKCWSQMAEGVKHLEQGCQTAKLAFGSSGSVQREFSLHYGSLTNSFKAEKPIESWKCKKASFPIPTFIYILVCKRMWAAGFKCLLNVRDKWIRVFFIIYPMH